MWRPRADRRSDLMHFVMIKPSHYDDDGYPIQWVRSAIPSNTLACLNALAEDAKRREVLGSGVEIRLHTYDETNRRVHPNRIIRMLRKQGGRALIGLVGVQSNQFPARGRSGAALPGRRPAGLHRRLPRLRLHRHAAGTAAGHPRRAGARHLVLRRRGRRRPVRRGAAGRLERQARAALQPHGQAAEPDRRAAAVPAAPARPPHLGLAVERGPRPRLPVPVLVLHHHQRAGPQEPVSLARRSRAHRARELRAGHQAVLHHRRQFRPQPRLGNPVRPPDPAARRADFPTSASPSRSIRCATRSRTSSRRRRRPASGASSSGWRTSTPTI